ncbi:MAG: DUF2892 domain-containing protein [Pseudomonadota bacterium]
MVTKNVGGLDRLLRAIVGLALLGAFFAFPEAEWRYWTLIGIIPLATAAFATCPAYSLVGLSTCPRKTA